MIDTNLDTSLDTSLDTPQNRAKEVVLLGSLFEALYKDFVKIEDVLEYLLDNEPKDEYQKKRMCITYRIVCLITKNQYVRNDHFICLTDNIDYIAIYSLSFTHFTVDDSKSNFIILKKVQKIIPQLAKARNLRFLHIICDMTKDDFKFNNNDGVFVTCVRSIKNMNRFLNDYTALILADYLDGLELIDKNLYVDETIYRCVHLMQEAPFYWKYVAYDLYYNFVKNKFADAKNFSKETINFYNECFPNLFSEKIKNRDELSIDLYNKDNVVAAYMLGFPIHQYIPSEEKVSQAIDSLQEMGIEKYCETLSKNVPVNAEIANPENVYMDKIENFNPFDVVYHYTDNCHNIHLFRFTRSEFENILKDEKNFYTGKQLPLSILEEIKCRNNIAEQYKLPKCKTIYELLSEKEEEKKNFVLGRAMNREDGEERIFRLEIPDELVDEDDEVLDDFLDQMLEERGLEYLGRVMCSCQRCNSSEFDDEDEDENFEEDSSMEFSFD